MFGIHRTPISSNKEKVLKVHVTGKDISYKRKLEEIRPSFRRRGTVGSLKSKSLRDDGIVNESELEVLALMTGWLKLEIMPEMAADASACHCLRCTRWRQKLSIAIATFGFADREIFSASAGGGSGKEGEEERSEQDHDQHARDGRYTTKQVHGPRLLSDPSHDDRFDDGVQNECPRQRRIDPPQICACAKSELSTTGTCQALASIGRNNVVASSVVSGICVASGSRGIDRIAGEVILQSCGTQLASSWTSILEFQLDSTWAQPGTRYQRIWLPLPTALVPDQGQIRCQWVKLQHRRSPTRGKIGLSSSYYEGQLGMSKACPRTQEQGFRERHVGTSHNEATTSSQTLDAWLETAPTAPAPAAASSIEPCRVPGTSGLLCCSRNRASPWLECWQPALTRRRRGDEDHTMPDARLTHLPPPPEHLYKLFPSIVSECHGIRDAHAYGFRHATGTATQLHFLVPRDSGWVSSCANALFSWLASAASSCMMLCRSSSSSAAAASQGASSSGSPLARSCFGGWVLWVPSKFHVRALHQIRVLATSCTSGPTRTLNAPSRSAHVSDCCLCVDIYGHEFERSRPKTELDAYIDRGRRREQQRLKHQHTPCAEEQVAHVLSRHGGGRGSSSLAFEFGGELAWLGVVRVFVVAEGGGVITGAESSEDDLRVGMQIDMKELVVDAVGNAPYSLGTESIHPQMPISPKSRDTVLAARRITDLESRLSLPR
ncbi:hypothetical protein DFH06DRAFT_1353627 [Mycena polygramma]|nr:hypothetical protein DFH06DRAFT_1353627 [Mycena polygramma]